MKHKKKTTKFERFSKKFLIITCMLYTFGIVVVNSYKTYNNRQIQVISNEIANCKKEIESLEVQLQDMVSFEKLSKVANAKGYTYRFVGQINATDETAITGDVN